MIIAIPLYMGCYVSEFKKICLYLLIPHYAQAHTKHVNFLLKLKPYRAIKSHVALFTQIGIFLNPSPLLKRETQQTVQEFLSQVLYYGITEVGQH